MHEPNVWSMIWRLAAALLLGGLIGLERETHGRPAGLRTHILVCMGSALFTLCSYSIAGKLYDPGRITAQIVTGIGFLGAGTIMRQGSVVKGLTTAASVWTVAAIGIAVAIGGTMFYVATAASLLVVLTLNVVPQLERWLQLKQGEHFVTLVVRSGAQQTCEVLSILAKHGLVMRTLISEEGTDPGSQILRFRVRVSRALDDAALGAELVACSGVISYSWD